MINNALLHCEGLKGYGNSDYLQITIKKNKLECQTHAVIFWKKNLLLGCKPCCTLICQGQIFFGSTIFINSYPAEVIYLNFQPLEVVSRYRDTQLQVIENSLYLFNLRTNMY